jgi:photosystem II stability/assembly factor-like uncharacterized protein
MVKDRLCIEGDLRGWCWQRPLPTGNRTKDMAFVDASTGWVVGEGGEILKTQDGGGNWSRRASHVLSDLTHIRFVDASTGWIAGADGVVLRTTDAGANWVRQANSGVDARDGELGFVALDDQRAVVTPFSGFPRATFDGGTTWTEAGLVPMQVTEDGTLWNFDGGAVRRATRLGLDAPTVSYIADQHWVSQFSMGTGRDGLLLLHDYWTPSFQQLRRTTDGGASWVTVATTGLPSGVSYLKFFGASDAWAVASGALYRSADAGSTWSSVTLPVDAEPSDLTHILVAKDAKTLWFSHDHGYFLTTDGGSSWVWLRVEEEESLGDLGVNAGGVWQWHGFTIYQSVDAGQHWRLALGLGRDQVSLLTSVWFFDSQRGMALSFSGLLLDTRNGGRDWTPRTPDDLPNHSYNGRLHFATDSVGWKSGWMGIYKTSDGGATWRLPVTDAPMFNVTDYTFVDANNGWAVTDEEYVVHTSDGGESWTLQASDFFGLNAVAFADARTGIVAGIDGMMRRTTDGGVTWHEIDSGVTNYIQRVKFTSATTGWAIGTSGMVLTTTDAGATWSRVSVPTEKHLMGIAFADVDHGWIFGGAGTVLATRDGGKTWTGQASGAAGGALVGGFFLDANTGWVFGQDGLLATATGGQ